MRTLGMAVRMTSITLILSIVMGQAAVTPQTIPDLLASMRSGLSVFAVFSCLGALLSFYRTRKRR